MSATPAATEPLLQVRGMVKHYPVRRGLFGGSREVVHAVDGVDLDVPAGQTLGLVGESGCGKTTLARCILRLVEPTRGSVRFDGVEILTLPPRQMRALRQDLQVVFQDPYSSLNPRMRVGEIVGEPLLVHRLARNRSEREQRVAELLETVGLDPSVMRRYPHEFSGGQRQRIGIARALSVKPRLIVADEPVSALDVSVQAQVVNLFLELQERFGLSYLFISHDLRVIRHVSQRVAVMYLGRIVELADSVELLENPRHPYTKALIAAVPVPDPRARASRATIRGEPPNPFNPPSGCAFHARCPHADEKCRLQLPEFRRINKHHSVACHHFEALV